MAFSKWWSTVINLEKNELEALESGWRDEPERILTGLVLHGRVGLLPIQQVIIARLRKGNDVDLVSDMPLNLNLEWGFHVMRLSPVDVFNLHADPEEAWHDQDMARVAANIRSDRPASHASFWETGPQCNPSCGVIAWEAANKPGAPGITQVVEMVNFVPVHRSLFRIWPEGYKEGPLSAAGFATSVQTLRHLMNTTDKDSLVATELQITSGETAAAMEHNRVVKDDMRALTRVSVEEALASLSSLFYHRDGESLHAAVMDRGLDLRDSAVAKFMRMERPVTLVDVLKGTTDATMSTGVPVRNLQSLFNPLSSHGTQVAAVLGGDSANVRFFWLDLGAMLWTEDVKSLGRQYAKFLEQKGVKVAVSALFYGYAVPAQRCEQFYDALFRAAPNVLFVLAAGNNGLREYTSCSLGVARRHRNVLVVAGTDASGAQLHAQSNRGSQTVDLAAPWGSEDVPLTGTSHAAPWVGNLALNYFEHHPMAAPPEVVDALCNACDDVDMDVACGGKIDREKFLRVARSAP